MLYVNQTTQIIFCISAIILFLLIDLGQFFLIGVPIIPFLMSFYCIFILCNPRFSIIAFISFLVGLEYFCFYHSFLYAGACLVPISILGVFFKKNLYPSYSHPITLALIAAFIQTYAIEGYFLHIWSSNYYTIMRFGGTLFITICFSLTINIWGIQDNRA